MCIAVPLNAFHHDTNLFSLNRQQAALHLHSQFVHASFETARQDENKPQRLLSKPCYVLMYELMANSMVTEMSSHLKVAVVAY